MFCSSSYIEFVSQANLIITPRLCSISLLHSFVELSITNCAEKLLHWGRSQCTSWQYRHQWKSEKWKSELWTWHALWKSTLGEIVGVIIIGDIAFGCPSKCIFVSLHTSTFVFSYYYRCIIEGGIIAACVQSQAERISSPSTPQITSKAKLLYWTSTALSFIVKMIMINRVFFHPSLTCRLWIYGDDDENKEFSSQAPSQPLNISP